MKRSAVFSPCKRYRYELVRNWSTKFSYKSCTFILLNPSTADHRKDDPTIRRCIGFARRFKCEELRVVNLFAFRATSPLALKKFSGDPIGDRNKEFVERACYLALHRTGIKGTIVCGWGNHGSYMQQSETVLGWIEHFPLQCFGNTNGGHPKHPLYLKTTAPLMRYQP